MEQTGIIRETMRGMALVEIQRGSACGESCASCGMCPGQSVKVAAFNDAGAAVGDEVIISMSGRKVIGAAFLVYIVPLVALVAGYFAGYALFESEAYGIVSGLLIMAISFCGAFAADRRLRERYVPHIKVIAESAR